MINKISLSNISIGTLRKISFKGSHEQMLAEHPANGAYGNYSNYMNDYLLMLQLEDKNIKAARQGAMDMYKEYQKALANCESMKAKYDEMSHVLHVFDTYTYNEEVLSNSITVTSSEDISTLYETADGKLIREYKINTSTGALDEFIIYGDDGECDTYIKDNTRAISPYTNVYVKISSNNPDKPVVVEFSGYDYAETFINNDNREQMNRFHVNPYNESKTEYQEDVEIEYAFHRPEHGVKACALELYDDRNGAILKKGLSNWKSCYDEAIYINKNNVCNPVTSYEKGYTSDKHGNNMEAGISFNPDGSADAYMENYSRDDGKITAVRILKCTDGRRWTTVKQ